MKSWLLFLVCFVLLIPVASDARTWVVKKDGTGDCITIQACIDAAGDGDTVLVGPGVYAEELRIEDRSGLALISECGPAYTQFHEGGFFSTIFMRSVSSPSLIEGFTFAHSFTITGMGGAIDCGRCFITIIGNVMFDCAASTWEGGGGIGGAMHMLGVSGTISGNTIYACLAGPGDVGGGIYVDRCPNLAIERNIIVSCRGGGIFGYNNVPFIFCNDVWNNTPSNYGGVISDQTGINGNISVNPLFCDPSTWNLFLNCTSPCLNPSGCGRMGALPMGCGPTAVEQTTWGRIKSFFR